VLVKNPKFRKGISDNQKYLLIVLYKFRFVTTDLVAEFISKDRSTIYESFYVLEKQAYIQKLYDSTYRLRQRPATYCLASKGIRFLRDNTDLDQTTLRNFYKNNKTRQEHIDHCLNVFTIFLSLKRQTGKKFDIFTKYELNREANLKPLPELYLKREGKSKKPDYLLDIMPASTFSWLIRKRIQQYEDFADDSEYLQPNVLLVAGNESTEKRLFKLLYENYADFKYFITQQQLLLNGKDGKVWIDVGESEEDEMVEVNL